MRHQITEEKWTTTSSTWGRVKINGAKMIDSTNDSALWLTAGKGEEMEDGKMKERKKALIYRSHVNGKIHTVAQNTGVLSIPLIP